MLGIGHRQDKYTKIKILASRAKSYNQKYDELIAEGLDPQEVASILQKEEYQKRHQDHYVQEPYKTSTGINQIGGAVHQGYHKTHKNLTETQSLYAPLNTVVQAQKSGGTSNFRFTKTSDELFEQKKIIDHIQKDHVGDILDIDLGEKKSTDYKRHFNDDEKMKDIRGHQDKQFNSRKNALNWYVEESIKTKDILRK